METPKKQFRIESLRVQNFRALRDVEIMDITPLTVLLGPNGSGKSTVFDVFEFLTDCFREGLENALEKRGGFNELRSRRQDGEIGIGFAYTDFSGNEGPQSFAYSIKFNEMAGQLVVSHEQVNWRKNPDGPVHTLLDIKNGKGSAKAGKTVDGNMQDTSVNLSSPEALAIDSLGQHEQHPYAVTLRDFVRQWRFFNFSTENMQNAPSPGPQKQLSESGDNLANVVHYLEGKSPEVLQEVTDALRRMVPAFEQVSTSSVHNQLWLQLKDAPFDKPVLAKYASDGTLKLLAYLVLLKNPNRPPLICLEEPENFLYPQLMHDLAEQCAIASPGSQVMVTTHSPSFLTPLLSKQVRVLSRGPDGFTTVKRPLDVPGIKEFVESGLSLDELWMADYFNEPQKINA